VNGVSHRHWLDLEVEAAANALRGYIGAADRGNRKSEVARLQHLILDVGLCGPRDEFQRDSKAHENRHARIPLSRARCGHDGLRD